MPRDIRGGHPTYWTTFGTGPRQALLIHCSLAHSGAWKGVAAALGERLTMRAYDLPGHGRSGDWTPARDMQDLSVAMAADLIGAEGPVDVIGHSFGATVGLRLAIERPDLVRSLVMIESVFVAAALADDPVLAEQHHDTNAGYIEALKRGDRMEAARAFMTEWGDGRPWQALPREHQKFLASKIHLIQANQPTVLEDRPGLLRDRRIEALDVPALLIRGADSSGFVEPIHKAIVRRLKGARDIAIPGAGHMAPITHPDETAALIAEFLDTVPEI
ncbi:alpha/beta fold hydrolase [Marimonas arenosa]|uniref:Alpha/beta hydrolase n=1 Tax=Marimonas arenosa TaxID=1795305 RepID=A0AAE3WEF4_9RHOB|nr:alpha/beta hydrolase [Marimonas arenosa]MDQ2090190.1 alpha/beta hydrolase [Marimonas arenosa]